MSKELWRSTLETLRGRFEAGAERHHRLRCLLIHAGPGEKDRINECLARFNIVEGEGDWQIPSVFVYRDSDTPDAFTTRYLTLLGGKAGASLFRTRATDAGRCLEQLPPENRDAIQPESLRVNSSFPRWLCCLFDLAWCGCYPALVAERKLWEGRGPFMPYDRRSLGFLLSCSHPWSKHLPDFYQAELPDVFMASVYGIDVLLAGRPSAEVVQYVTLDNMAALVPRSKRTLEKLKSRKANPLPSPDVEGGGGRPDEWNWSTVRPWLEQEYGRHLPERFPADRFSDARADRS